MTTPPFGPPMDDGDVQAAARMLSLAFAASPEGASQWIDRAGREHLRILRDEQGPGACFMRVPMGQYFGGRSVPMVGIAGVAVPPERRGSGLAISLMREALREIARERAPLSTLYASTQALYRQVGYEQAGHRFLYRFPLDRLGVRERAMAVKALAEDAQQAIVACASEFARAFDGTLDRGPYCWGRVRANRDERYDGFGVFADDGSLEGYVFLTQRRKVETGRAEITISDLAFTTARAGRRLLGLLADFATVGDDALLFAGPIHPLCTLMPQQRFSVEKRDYWMLRIVNLPAAIEARGFPCACRGAVTLDVRDDLLPENAGRWTISVADGRGRAEPGRDGPTLRLDIRGVAAIYSGFYSVRQAALVGLVEGDEDAFNRAEAVFPTSTPWMIDMF